MFTPDRVRLWKRARPSSLRRWVGYLALAAPLVAMSVGTGLDFRLIGDERRFHLAAIERFALLGPAEAVFDYPAASTPLPYILWAGLGSLVGFEIWKLRLLSVAATYFAAVLFFNLAKRHGLPFPLASSLIFMFMPYIFFHGFTVYTTNFGLLFGIAALHFYLANRDDASTLFLGSLLTTLAIYCRQNYLVLPLGMVLYELSAINWRAQGVLAAARRNLGRLFVLALPAIAFFPLIILWNGLTPPQFQQSHFVNPTFQHLNFLPVFVGFYFLPQLFGPQVTELIRNRKLALLSLAVAFPVFLLFPPFYSEDPGAVGATTGIIARSTHLLGQHLSDRTPMFLMAGLWTVGFVIIIGVVTSPMRGVVDRKLLPLIISFLLLMTLTPTVSERYYTLALPFLVLMIHRGYRQRGFLIFWVVVQVALSIAFSYWQIAMKTSW